MLRKMEQKIPKEIQEQYTSEYTLTDAQKKEKQCNYFEKAITAVAKENYKHRTGYPEDYLEFIKDNENLILEYLLTRKKMKVTNKTATNLEFEKQLKLYTQALQDNCLFLHGGAIIKDGSVALVMFYSTNGAGTVALINYKEFMEELGIELNREYNNYVLVENTTDIVTTLHTRICDALLKRGYFNTTADYEKMLNKDIPLLPLL